jgi:hypothetical protein
MRHLKTGLAVLGAAVILVLAANSVSLAATGQALLLGKSNSANANTSITRTTSGSVLKLQSKSSTNAPLTVNGKGKVANLNADQVDGLSAASLQTRANGWTVPISVDVPSVSISIPLSQGSYLLSYSAYMISGGADGGTAGCYFIRDDSSTTYFGETKILTATGKIPGVSGSGFVTVGPSTDVRLYCSGAANFHTSNAEPIQISALRVDSLTSGNIVLPKRTTHAPRVAAKQ